MGRAFEFRKDRKMKRWALMSRVFTKIGKELGALAEQHVRDLVNQWNKGDQDGNCKI